MASKFSKNIAPFVEAEITLASKSRALSEVDVEFEHLENAHVLGQELTYWHVKVHVLMLAWAIRNVKAKELFGQLFRIIGAALTTALGLIPEGNTGGANVSPFKPMPISSAHQEIIDTAKAGL